MWNSTLHEETNFMYLCGLLIFMGFVGSFVIDLYVPSMPAIARSFHVAPTAVKYTITVYLIAYGAFQLIAGTLLDLFGRKFIMINALLISLLGSWLCANALTIHTLYFGRVLQGVGFSAIGVGVPTLGRDIFSDELYAKASSIFAIVFGLGPVVAPIIGAYIQHAFGWRVTFYVIAGYTIGILFILIFLFPETHPKHARHPLKLRSLAKLRRSLSM